MNIGVKSVSRHCPYCSSSNNELFGIRGQARFARCHTCRSIFMDISLDEFALLHAEAFGDDSFINTSVHHRQEAPSFDVWDQFQSYFPDGPVLELGPGAGHFMAAARARNREVWGVEASLIHRNFIKDTWGFENIYATVSELPRDKRFGAIVLFNTIEHVYDVQGLMSELRTRLQPDGVILLSTANAGCFLVPIVGCWWSMFKPHDHVSIPSAMGFRELARATNLTLEKSWTTELPLQTPIEIAVAIRDFCNERLLHKNTVQPGRVGTGTKPEVINNVTLARRLARKSMSLARPIDPTNRIMAHLGMAASIKGLFRNI